MFWRVDSVSQSERCDCGRTTAARRRRAASLLLGRCWRAEATRAATRKQRKIGRAAMGDAPQMQTRTLNRCINLIATLLRTLFARDLDGWFGGVRQPEGNFNHETHAKNPPRCRETSLYRLAGDKTALQLIFKQMAAREATSLRACRAQAGEARPPSRTLADRMGKWTPSTIPNYPPAAGRPCSTPSKRQRDAARHNQITASSSSRP